MNRTTEDVKDSFLSFLSSGLTYYAGTFVGLAVILFTYLNVVIGYFPRIPLRLEFHLSWLTLRYFFSFLILFVVNAAMIFTLMRLIIYGKLAAQTVLYGKSADSLRQLNEEVVKRIEGIRLFGILPLRWFFGGIEEYPRGFWLSLGLSCLVSITLMWTFLFS